MPFDQHATFQPGLILQGQLDAAQQIAEALKEQKKMQIEGAYNDQIMSHAEQLGAVTPEEMTKYQAAGHRQKIGIASGVAANMMDSFKRQQEKDINDQRIAQIAHLNAQSNLLIPAQAAADTERANLMNRQANAPAWDTQIIQKTDPATGKVHSFYMQNPHSVVRIPDAGEDTKAGDTFEKANREMRAISGGGISQWKNAQNTHVEGDEVVAELPATNVYDKPKILRMPTGKYLELQKRYNKLIGSDSEPVIPPPGTTASLAQPTPTPTPGILSRIATAITGGSQSNDLKALAQKALNDPKATAEQKDAARKILGQ